MELVDQIKALRAKAQKKEIKHECKLCNDTGWIVEGIGENSTYKKCVCRIKKENIASWKRFGLDPEKVKKINDYNATDEVRKKARNMAVNYIKTYEPTKCMLLSGNPGAGKTHLSIGIGAALLEKGVAVVYMPYLESIRELKANSMDNEYYLRLIGKYYNAKLLIIDDLFKDKVKNGKLVGALTESDIKHIYSIINFRYNNKLSTVISTELLPQQLIELDEALAGRIIEMCNNNIVTFEGQKYNYRLKNVMEDN